MRLKMKKLIWFLCIALVIGLAWSAQATLIFEDDFNDGALDPNWAVTFEGTQDWTFEESGTELIAYDIIPTNPITTLDGWSRVYLSRSLPSLTDFDIEFDFSWDSAGTSNAIQRVFVSFYTDEFRLYDDHVDPQFDPNTIGYGGYADTWAAINGIKKAFLGNYTQDWVQAPWSTSMTLPLSDSAFIEIIRTDDLVTFYWDGIELISRTDSRPLDAIAISFSHYDNYVFGTESVDLIRVTGEPAPVPEPSTILMIASGLIGLVGFKKMFKKR